MLSMPFRQPAMEYFPSGVNATAVIISGTAVTKATLLSGILHKRNFVSSDPARKNRSSRGWNCIEVTKSLCWKQQRHSGRDMCHSRTVLSIDEDRRKLFWFVN